MQPNRKLIDEFSKLFQKDAADAAADDGPQLKANQAVIVAYCAELAKLSDDKAPARGTILYHGLGTGKTITALRCADALSNDTRKRLFFLIPASLVFSPWLSSMCHGIGTIPRLGEAKETVATLLNVKREPGEAKIDAAKRALATKYQIHIIHHNANNLLDKVNQAAEMAGDNNPFNNSVVVIDEIHDFINTLVNTKSAENQKMTVYRLLMAAKNMRIISATGTPFVNTPYELAFLANLHRGWEIFDVSSSDSRVMFLETFFHGGDMSTTRSKLITALYGIVSYYKTNEADMPRKNYMPIQFMEMNETQDRLHQYLERKRMEHEDEMKAKRADQDEISMSTYQARRARIGKMNAHGNLLAALSAGRVKMVDDDGDENFSSGDYRVGQRMNSNWCIPFNLAIKLGMKEPYTMGASAPASDPAAMTDMRVALKRLRTEFKVDLVRNLHHFSPKIERLFSLVKKSKSTGPFMIYSNFKNYGIYPISAVLDQMGFEQYTGDNLDPLAPAPRYVMFTGDQTQSQKFNMNRMFNSIENIDGDLIRFILITGAGKQGISLKYVRACFILEPYWTSQLTEQVEGRAVRIGSHVDLPPELRKVDIYKFISVAPKTLESIDLMIANIAQYKSIQIEKIQRLMMRSAIDCIVHLKVNFPGAKAADQVCVKADGGDALPYPERGRQIEYTCNAKALQLKRVEVGGKIYISQYNLKFNDIPGRDLEDVHQNELVLASGE